MVYSIQAKSKMVPNRQKCYVLHFFSDSLIFTSDKRGAATLYIDRKFHAQKSACRFRVFSLAFLWSAGLLSGGFAALLRIGEGLFLTGSHPSFLQILLLSLLPLLVSAICLRICFGLIFPIVFLKGISYGYSSGVLIVSNPGCGWLVRCLVMLPSTCALLVTWVFWLCAIETDELQMSRRLLYATLTILVAVFFYFYLITPLLYETGRFADSCWI